MAQNPAAITQIKAGVGLPLRIRKGYTRLLLYRNDSRCERFERARSGGSSPQLAVAVSTHRGAPVEVVQTKRCQQHGFCGRQAS